MNRLNNLHISFLIFGYFSIVSFLYFFLGFSELLWVVVFFDALLLFFGCGSLSSF